MIEYVVAFVVLIFSVVVHETSHAWMAYRRGDPTAFLAGRLTLNPLPHLDPIGSIVLPLFGILSGAPVIGWAKPVPVNPARLRHPAQDQFWVSLAGPGSNFTLAVLFTFLYGIVLGFGVLGPAGRSLVILCSYGVLINLVLGFFNLLPVPPLDGSWIFGHLFPHTVGRFVAMARQYGFIILIVLLFSGLLRYVLAPAFFLARLLLGIAEGVVL
jgi:Zn-dependent protease